MDRRAPQHGHGRGPHVTANIPEEIGEYVESSSNAVMLECESHAGCRMQHVCVLPMYGIDQKCVERAREGYCSRVHVGNRLHGKVAHVFL